MGANDDASPDHWDRSKTGYEAMRGTLDRSWRRCCREQRHEREWAAFIGDER